MVFVLTAQFFMERFYIEQTEPEVFRLEDCLHWFSTVMNDPDEKDLQAYKDCVDRIKLNLHNVHSTMQ